MKIYKNGKQIFNGKSVAIDKVSEMGTNDLLVDIHDDGRKQALRIVRNANTSRITLCNGEQFELEDIVGECFVKTWEDGLFPLAFTLDKDFLNEIPAIDDAVFTLRSYKDHIILV